MTKCHKKMNKRNNGRTEMGKSILGNRVQDILIDFQSNLNADEDSAYEMARAAILSLLATNCDRADETV